MEKDSGRRLTELTVDGGMSNSALCMQTQADVSQIAIVRPGMLETTALGAAIAAGFAVGVWQDFAELKEVNTRGQTVFEPKLPVKTTERMFRRWERAVQMSKGWLTEEDDDHEGELPSDSTDKKDETKA